MPRRRLAPKPLAPLPGQLALPFAPPPALLPVPDAARRRRRRRMEELARAARANAAWWRGQ